VSWVVIALAMLCAGSALANLFMAWRRRSDRQDAALRLISGVVGLLPIVGVLLVKTHHLALNPSLRARYILIGVALLLGLTLLLPASIQRARQRRRQQESNRVKVQVGGSDPWVN